MKRLFTLLLISFAALSCEMVDEKLDELLGKKDIVVFAEGTELTANVSSKQTVLNYKFESTLDWEVKTEADWLEIDPMSGKAGKDIKIQIKVLHNKDKEGRTGYADLTLSNNDSYRITINQAGEGDENEDIVVEIPNNQIWYTSVNGEIVEPYSDEDGIQDNFTTFGANIISNTYENGQGVITFDGDVTTIGEWAFYGYSSLTSVTIPDSVTTIGGSAFSNCSSLTSVTIPDSVTTIGGSAFYNCSSLTSVTIPDSVTTIGNSAFSGCDSLTSVTIPDSVTTIGDYAFSGCSSLTSVTIPDSVTTIGEGAFVGCSSLQEFNGKFASEDGRCLIIDGTLNSFAPVGLTEYTIPDSVTTIGWFAFAGCTSLISITIPDSVTSIGDCALSGCNSLTSVTIPDSATEIGSEVFYGCSSLQEFNGKFASEDGRCLIIDGVLNSFAPAGLTEYTIPDSVTMIGNGAFNLCSNLTSVTIGDSVTTIGNGAFCGCSSLTSITIPDSVTTIGIAAFQDCYDLTSITIPNSVTEIGDLAFSWCESLTSITIPDSVTEIGEHAFAECSSLTSVTIGDSVTTIGDWAFSSCRSLTSVYCKATTPPAVDDDMFYDNASDRKIYVPMESVEAYKSAYGWSDYAADIVGYNFEE